MTIPRSGGDQRQEADYCRKYCGGSISEQNGKDE